MPWLLRISFSPPAFQNLSSSFEFSKTTEIKCLSSKCNGIICSSGTEIEFGLCLPLNETLHPNSVKDLIQLESNVIPTFLQDYECENCKNIGFYISLLPCIVDRYVDRIILNR